MKHALTLWFGLTPVADLSKIGLGPQALRLSYRPAWREAPDSFAISVSMPLSVASHQGPHIYNWFMNLLPEDDALKRIGQTLNVSDIDIMGLIAALGGDLPGALVARPFGEPPTAGQTPNIKVWNEAELAHDIRRLPDRPLLVGDTGVQISLAGQQDKLAVVKHGTGQLALPVNGMPSTHILKPAIKNLYACVENEAFCLRLALACGLPVANVEIGQAEDITYLLVERYDRVVRDGQTMRLHQEDLCQALGYPPFQKYEWNARIHAHGPKACDLFKAVNEGTRRGVNRLGLAKAFVFNVIVDNIDSHAKNYSLIHTDRSPTLAPLYDVMCGGIYDGVTRNMAQKIADQSQGNHIHGRHWATFAREIEFSAPEFKKLVKTMAETIAANLNPIVNHYRDETPLSAVALASIADVIRQRASRVMANLDS